MEKLRGGERGGHVAVSRMQDEGGKSVGRVGWDEPAGELGRAGSVDAKTDGLKLQLERCRGLRDGVGGLQGELPLPLIEEPAERGVRAKEGDQQSDGEGLDEPARIDHFLRHRSGGLRFGCGFGSAFCHACYQLLTLRKVGFLSAAMTGDGVWKFSSGRSLGWFLQRAKTRHILLAGLGPQCIEITVQWTCFRKGLEMKLRR